MDSLANYGSDGENSDYSEDSKNIKGKSTSTSKEQLNDNYEPMQMDMSEESNNNNNNNNNSSENNSENGRGKSQSPVESCSGPKSDSSSRRLSSNQRNSVGDDKHRESRGASGDSKHERHRHEDRTSSSSSSRRHNDDKRRENDYKNKKHHDDDDDNRKSRDYERKKEKYLTNKNDKRDDKTSDKFERDYRDDSHKEKKRDRDRRNSRRDRKERHRDDISYRSSSSSSSNYKDRRSRSRSKERTIQQSRPMSYREEKNRNKLAKLENLGIELKTPDNIIPTSGIEQNYYNPLTASTQGKYAEQIQKRKLLWANKAKQDEGNKTAAVGSTNTWLATTFTQDQDGKMTAKFKRLMGIKGEVAATTAASSSSTQSPGQKPDILKKQEEMFSNMEQQYEVARATTHTQRGVGLGYASSGYQFTR
ncbi:hypothetical protein HCN44_003216 [Aphidius gifuensis]|uniref:Small acidic protein-like domain-containing protein n=1 Tax=Aphidius gifuensis TaxID=684658 RepID=A0A835CLL2_APHGI|nr:arginine/serine-rich coiled-coil protein 2-like [Aphidius gifuensis]KAF7987454.1 hypothetical protein HCN44_003216 [Aphidius gifuensis]